MTQRRICTGCREIKHERYFARCSPDFPTPHGRNFLCRKCAEGRPRYRLVPSTGPFRKIELVEG